MSDFEWWTATLGGFFIGGVIVVIMTLLVNKYFNK